MGAHDIAYNLGGKFEERQAGLATGPLKYFVGGSGPALVHLHGGGGLRVSSALQTLTETFTVYMPVTPGFDGTAFHDQVNSFPELAEVMWRFVDDVVGAPCDISGHAFGGRLALWLAALHGPKLGQFIVQCPSGFRDGGPNELDPKAYAKALVTFPDRVPDEKKSDAIKGANRTAGHCYNAPGKGVVDDSVSRDHDLIGRLPDITNLTLLLQGTLDGVLPHDTVQFLKEKLPRSYLVYIYNAGHLMDMDEPVRWTELVRDFLIRGDAFLVNQGAANDSGRPQQVL